MGNKDRVIQLKLLDAPFTSMEERSALIKRIEILLNHNIKELTGDLSCRDFYTAMGSVIGFENTFKVE
jgi:hypothetical protein